MASQGIEVLTPVGRIVQGHPLRWREVTDDNNKPVIDPAGKPVMQLYFSLAISKQDPGFAEVWNAMSGAAQRDWPNGEFNMPRFSWKYLDGDTAIDDKGKPYNLREGFAGHHILKLSSRLPYQVVDPTGKGSITDEKAIKCGDYMRVYISVKGNAPSKTPGLYVNVQFAQLCGYGEAISSGPDVAAVLAKVGGFQLPAGASAMPVAGAPMPVVGMPAMPGQQPMQMAQPAYQPQMPMAQPAQQPMQMPGMPGQVAPNPLSYAPNPGILQLPR